jgi:hypothetical protein
LQRIVLASGAIKRGPAAFLKHLGALGDMMERSLALIDSDIQGPEPVQQLRSAYRRRMRQAALEFPRSAAEFFCAYSYADISAAKGNTFLQMATNPKFSPHDLSEFTSVQTMESKIMKFLFPEGHKIKNLTRQRDGKQLVLHYIPFIEVVRRLLRNEAFAGKMYHNFEVQWSARRNGVRAIGRSNTGTLFQGAQIRANRLAAGSGLAKMGLETRVAMLVTASDATYGEKNMPWHGVYGKAHITLRLHGNYIKLQ